MHSESLHLEYFYYICLMGVHTCCSMLMEAKEHPSGMGFFPPLWGTMGIELRFPGLEASIFIQPAEPSQQPNCYIVHHQISSCFVITVSLVAFLHPSSILGTVTSFLSQEITLHFLSFMEINSNSKCFPSF